MFCTSQQIGWVDYLSDMTYSVSSGTLSSTQLQKLTAVLQRTDFDENSNCVQLKG